MFGIVKSFIRGIREGINEVNGVVKKSALVVQATAGRVYSFTLDKSKWCWKTLVRKIQWMITGLSFWRGSTQMCGCEINELRLADWQDNLVRREQLILQLAKCQSPNQAKKLRAELSEAQQRAMVA